MPKHTRKNAAIPTAILAGIDVDVFKPGLTPIRHLRDDNVNILFVGRLEKRKGLGDLLRGYRFMRARVPESRLIVVGDGPLRGRVESYVSRHRLPNVVLAGYVPESVLPRYYGSADIFCAPATGAESSLSVSTLPAKALPAKALPAKAAAARPATR